MALFKRFIPRDETKSRDTPAATPAALATPPESLSQISHGVAEVAAPQSHETDNLRIGAEELAATFESGGALSLDDAERETGRSLPLANWRREIVAYGAIADCDIERLREVSLVFLQTRHALEAALLGWDDLDLFGVFDGAVATAKGRLDARGLVPLLAWAPWQPIELEAVEPQFATIITAGGSTLQHRRQRPARDLAVAWWRSVYLRSA